MMMKDTEFREEEVWNNLLIVAADLVLTVRPDYLTLAYQDEWRLSGRIDVCK